MANSLQVRNIMYDIKATVAFLKNRGFKRIEYQADCNGIFAVDEKTGSGFFFPKDMSLEDTENVIVENRKLYGLSVNSH